MSLCSEYLNHLLLWSGSAEINAMLVFVETEIEKNMDITMHLSNAWKCADPAGLVQGGYHTSIMFQQGQKQRKLLGVDREWEAKRKVKRVELFREDICESKQKYKYS